MDNWSSKNMTEKISVIIITRNREKMLEGCLESLVKQTRLPDEVIVVDNASTDKTKKVIFSFKKKLPIKYFMEKKVGMPYAQNRGIREASGELLLFLDDDCEANKFWVERIKSAHEKYKNAWAIQGRTFSSSKKKLYCLLADLNRFISVQNHVKTKCPLSLEKYFSNNFKDEIEFSTCDGNNFSIKTLYLKKYKLSLDESFYRGLDTDLGKQIISKNGSIIFCPQVQVDHWERDSLVEFLNQRWHTGRTAAKIANKWKAPSLKLKITQGPRKLLVLVLFCKTSNQLINLPILLILFFLDKLYYLNGYFYEKRLLFLEES